MSTDLRRTATISLLTLKLRARVARWREDLLFNAEDCDEEHAESIRADENAYDGIDVEMVTVEESNTGHSAVRLTTETTITATTNNQPIKKVKSEPTSVDASEQMKNVLVTPHLNYSIIVEPDWFKKDQWQDGWKNKILPTLCLWAGAQTNIWSSPKARVASVLLHIIPVVFPDLGLFAIKLTPADKLINTFVTGDMEQITEEVAEFLKDNSYLYEDLISHELQKAFHGDFIINLLATTYLSNVKGHVHVEELDMHALAFCGIKGILGLCCAAIKRGLQLVNTVGLEGLVKGKLTPRPPASFNKQVGKVTMGENSFSDQHWGDATRGITRAAERCSDAQLHDILSKVQQVARELAQAGDEQMDNDCFEDEYAHICTSPCRFAEYTNIDYSGQFSLVQPLPLQCCRSCFRVTVRAFCPVASLPHILYCFNPRTNIDTTPDRPSTLLSSCYVLSIEVVFVACLGCPIG
ncbi:hypothetical protein JVT61DRAFT_9572 [Boletus reticuloceps]|uniref:Uncharacterized protein n=1 Tax=Boletus reticuloceps TaxID=495285 RepID=A0A8I2YFW5_9AGAM|nr:hypothetical protein JVT61DRAFT_9572 [Boletus reticuloceps]